MLWDRLIGETTARAGDRGSRLPFNPKSSCRLNLFELVPVYTLSSFDASTWLYAWFSIS